MTAWMGARRGRGQGERPLLTTHLEWLPALVRGGCGGGRAILCTPGRTGAVSSGTKAGPPYPWASGRLPQPLPRARGRRLRNLRAEVQPNPHPGPAAGPRHAPPPPHQVRPAHPWAGGLCRGKPYLVSSGSSSIKPDSHLGQM